MKKGSEGAVYMGNQWPAIGFEELGWEFDPDAAPFISKTQRRKIGSTYMAALPLHIAERSVETPPELSARISDLLVRLAHFDAEQRARGYSLPAMLLRSESSASSQIENLTSSVRNVALAELSSDAPHNAKLIVGNVEAMRSALAFDRPLDINTILQIHETLVNRDGQSFGGKLREEQVWVGGTPYSPHGAAYVPPQYSRVPAYLDDLVAFAGREDIDPVLKASIVHAQFECIHPFIDGNGRTGRVLLHKLLRDAGVLSHATLPVSAGLLHDVDAYMASIVAYQQGDPIAVVERLVDALEIAAVVGGLVSAKMDGVIDGWTQQFTERRGSSIYHLPAVLVEQPVVTSEYLAKRLGITVRAARTLVTRACEYGVLRPLGNRRRGEFYQSDEIVEVLEQVSDVQGIRRVVSGQGL